MTADPGPDPRAPIAAAPVHPDELDEPAYQALMGRWVATPPAAVAQLLSGAPFRWWIAGGWALELAGGRARAHVDTEVAFLLRDLPAVRRWFADLHLWAPRPDGLRPLLPGTPLLPDEDQLWVRPDAASPWILDLEATPTDGEDWLFRRDHRIRRPLARIGAVTAEGVAYQRPEIVLLFKAHLDREKDRRDLAGVRSQLDETATGWLISALDAVSPDHPWRTALLGST